VAPESQVKKISNNPAWVADWTNIHGAIQPFYGSITPSTVSTPLGPMWAWSVEQAANRIYKRNGITNPRKELDVVEVYDMATWAEIEWWERIHLCERNDAHKLVEERATWLDGDIPVNPSGGVTSTNAIGASAMQRIAEIAIQIRGEGGERQVPNVKQGLAVTAGGDMYSAAVLIKKSL
jgi:acetyl-CoA C-acetyltransferase